MYIYTRNLPIRSGEPIMQHTMPQSHVAPCSYPRPPGAHVPSSPWAYASALGEVAKPWDNKLKHRYAARERTATIPMQQLMLLDRSHGGPRGSLGNPGATRPPNANECPRWCRQSP